MPLYLVAFNTIVVSNMSRSPVFSNHLKQLQYGQHENRKLTLVSYLI